MGLSFDMPVEAVAPEPSMGRAWILNMTNAIDTAKAVTDHSVRTSLLDGLNNRYRSTAFRNMIKKLREEGKVDDKQIREMHALLASIRNVPRAPGAKSWRYQWP